MTDRANYLFDLAFPPVAALYVETGGSYYNLPGVHPFDENADARMYQGPYPVVAHPPCPRWGKMYWGQPAQRNTPQAKRLGDDKGCFKSALFDVRRFGGVLEHPEYSKAWAMFGLLKPPRRGGWVKADDHGGWTCRVEQGFYDHYCSKPTWLYVCGVNDLPDLRWGVSPPPTEDDFPKSAIEKHGIAYCRKAGVMAFKGGGRDSTFRIHTPAPFREVLISIARSVYDQ